MRRRPHSRDLRKGRVSAPWETYFISKCTEHRRPLLARAVAAEVVIDSLAYFRTRESIKLLAFVVLPEHFHVLFTLLPGPSLSEILRRSNSYTANRIRDLLALDGTVWQDDGFHDHRCRDDDEALAYAEYLEYNPVRRGLVTAPEDWPFSSAHPSRRHLLDWDWWWGWRTRD
ncbi:Transposase IS200 like protein [Aquisphaera giovannonii]|uniref:Transposase IS200 like protein n=1 Tax=Aquisphaera giovannonii TaxID=406548 RepID=A0A5B9W3W5_9BACT|nr:transposase [Aquisphaera giovannonii]QEH35282.1 Transposase IS200 like protein [Aquisphaera giovannonii]